MWKIFSKKNKFSFRFYRFRVQAAKTIEMFLRVAHREPNIIHIAHTRSTKKKDARINIFLLLGPFRRKPEL